MIILPENNPVHVPLPITKTRISELSTKLYGLTWRTKFGDVTKELLVFLRELWDEVVFPIMKSLQEFCPHGSHIWWCPTAEFSLLPLHATGSFRKGQLTFSDLYISSYTPTLTALIRACQKRSMAPPIEQHCMLLVGQAQAPGQSKLISMNTELSNISQCIASAATLSCVQDQYAMIAKVAEELKATEFVHLACHGIPNQK